MTRAVDLEVREFLPLRPTVLCVLRAISDGHGHGYAIMKAVESTSLGAVRMGPGTLYGVLQRVEEGGLVEELKQRPPDDDPRRRYYRLTKLGSAVFDAEAERLQRLLGTEASLGGASS